jgi:hypothetical protein
MPFGNDAFGVKGRKLFLNSVFELKIQRCFPVAVLVAQNGTRLARVMIAVVTEEDDFSTDLLLQSASCRNFSEQESLGKKSARLLAETNNRMVHGSARVS